MTKTTFSVTVDVETRSRGNPDRDIMGVVPGYGEEFGIRRMMDILESHGAHGTFFLNVYEVGKYEEDVIAGIARLIHDRGHDLELHTHPQSMYPSFYGMSDAPFEEQAAILEKGTSLIRAWTGRATVAHRAGAFLANRDTLRALEAIGVSSDCSLSPGCHDSVPLVGALGASNRVQQVGTVREIPVTYYDQLRVGRWHSRRILDIEGSSLAEIKRVTRWAIHNSVPTVCMLMHSFSFSRHDAPDWRVIRRFSALLAWLRKQDGIEIATIERVCQRLAAEQGALQVADGTPCTGPWLTWGRALQAWNDGWKNFVVAAAGIVALLVLALVLAGCGYVWFTRG